MSETQKQSPVIWRCSGCGALVHVSDERTPAAWCSRCSKFSAAQRDGGRRVGPLGPAPEAGGHGRLHETWDDSFRKDCCELTTRAQDIVMFGIVHFRSVQGVGGRVVSSRALSTSFSGGYQMAPTSQIFG